MVAKPREPLLKRKHEIRKERELGAISTGHSRRAISTYLDSESGVRQTVEIEAWRG